MVWKDLSAAASGILLAALLALVGPSCDLGLPLRPGERGPALEILYSSSFEAEADTSGWSVRSGVLFAGEAAPRGGLRSLYVSGGCIVPHGLVYLPRPSHSGELQLRFWGRSLVGGGSVALWRGTGPEYGTERVSIFVSDSVWTPYTSDLLPYTAGDTLYLTFNCGGIVLAAMLVDLIEVVRVSE